MKIVELLAKNEIFGFQKQKWQDCFFNMEDNEGKTAHHYACEKGNLEIVKLLLGVDSDDKALAKGTIGL